MVALVIGLVALIVLDLAAARFGKTQMEENRASWW